MIEKIKTVLKKLPEYLSNFFFGVKIAFKAAPFSFITSFILRTLASMIPIISGYALKEVINGVADAVGEKGAALLVFWLIVYILSMVFHGFLYEISWVMQNIVTQKFNHYIDLILIDKIALSDLSFFDRSKEQDILSVVKNNKHLLGELVWSNVSLLSSIISAAASLGIFFSLSPILAIITILLTFPSIILSRKYHNFIWEYDYQHSNIYRKTNYFSSVVTDKNRAAELRLYNNGEYFIDRYFKSWGSWFHEKNGKGIKYNIKLFFTNLLNQMSAIVVFIYSIFKFAAGKIGVGDIQYYVNLSSSVGNSVYSIIYTMSQMSINSEKISVVRDFLNWKPHLADEGDKTPSYMPEIEFRNVSFKYPGTDRYVLKDCSFIMKSGEKVALVGLNGAGKSTVVKLLLRFYDPDEGEILLDGVNAKEYSLKALRKVFGVQFQEFVTYSLTVGENVSIGNIEEYDEASVLSSLELSGADKFVSEYEKGIHTPITRTFEKDGIEPSGGQKQKLALARAFYRNAGIIILDEPSASLDPEAEYEIFLKFSKLWQGKGAILISHRLSNVTLCDKIIVIDGNRIAEVGSHKELMNKGGKYADLFNLQAGKYV